MQRFRTPSRVIAAALALGIALTGCGSSTGAKKTVTVVQTFTSSAGMGTASTSASVTVAAPTATAPGTAKTGPTGSGTAKTGTTTSTAQPTAKPTPKSTPHTTAAKTTPAATGGPLKKVNPLTVDCTTLLAASDIKKVTGTTVPNNSNRVKYAADAKSKDKGSVRCLFGLTGGKQKVSIRLTQYAAASGAADQIKVNLNAEQSLGAHTSSATVGGQPAQVMLRDGGLIDVQYGSWVLAVAAVNGVLRGDQAGQITQLAELALARVLKNAS